MEGVAPKSGRGGRRKRRRRKCPIPAAPRSSRTDALIHLYGPVLAIEFDNLAYQRRPAKVHFAKLTAVCQHSNACGTLYQEDWPDLRRPDGFGVGYCLRLDKQEPAGELWLHPSVRPVRNQWPIQTCGPILTRDELRQLGYLQIKQYPGNPLKHANCVEASPIYCEICRDYYPDDDLCRHVWWSIGHVGFVGPGSEGIKLPLDVLRGDVKAEVAEAGCGEVLVRALRAGIYPRGGLVRLDGDLIDLNLFKWTDAALWFDALGPDTPDEVEMTIAWLR